MQYTRIIDPVIRCYDAHVSRRAAIGQYWGFSGDVGSVTV